MWSPAADGFWPASGFVLQPVHDINSNATTIPALGTSILKGSAFTLCSRPVKSAKSNQSTKVKYKIPKQRKRGLKNGSSNRQKVLLKTRSNVPRKLPDTSKSLTRSLSSIKLPPAAVRKESASISKNTKKFKLKLANSNIWKDDDSKYSEKAFEDPELSSSEVFKKTLTKNSSLSSLSKKNAIAASKVSLDDLSTSGKEMPNIRRRPRTSIPKKSRNMDTTSTSGGSIQKESSVVKRLNHVSENQFRKNMNKSRKRSLSDGDVKSKREKGKGKEDTNTSNEETKRSKGKAEQDNKKEGLKPSKDDKKIIKGKEEQENNMGVTKESKGKTNKSKKYNTKEGTSKPSMKEAKEAWISNAKKVEALNMRIRAQMRVKEARRRTEEKETENEATKNNQTQEEKRKAAFRTRLKEKELRRKQIYATNAIYRLWCNYLNSI